MNPKPSRTPQVSEPQRRGLLHAIVNYRPDFLIVAILTAVVIALVLPVRGEAADIASLITKLGIAFLFFLYGARLSPQEALKGLMHWRLHLVILGFTFVLYPLFGLALAPVKPLVGEPLFLGILYLTLVPSTVQSSVAFTSIARGHVAASIVAASVSSLLGVFLTPLLVLLLMSNSGGLHVDATTFLDISIQLLLPFVLGQLLRRWVAAFAMSPATKKIDQLTIALVVYVSFSEGVVSGVWSRVSWGAVVGLIVGSAVAVYVMLWLTSVASRRVGFDYRDQVAVQFAGTKKSLSAGLPMAAVMFGGADLGMMILPLMIFHQVQLVICSFRASTYARRYAEDPAAARTW